MAALIDMPEAANRLARAIASDLSLYNEAKIKEGIENDTFLSVLAEEIEEGLSHYARRLDRLPGARLPQLSRSRIQSLIEEGHVAVAGAPAKASVRLRAGAEIEVRIPATRPSELVAEDLGLPILFEDEQLIVIDKPAGM